MTVCTTRRKCNTCGEYFIPEQDDWSTICSPCSWAKLNNKENELSIEFVKKSEHGYGSNGAAIKVVHALNGSEISNLLKLLIKECGHPYVHNLCAEAGVFDDVNHSVHGYMCAVQGAGAPSYTHKTKDQAVREAEKLAVAHHKPVLVLGRICTVAPETKEVVTTETITVVKHP